MTSLDAIPAPFQRDLTELVLGVTGVTAVYPPNGMVTHVPEIVAATVSGRQARMNRVHVARADGTVRVIARIGTSRDVDTHEVARHVATVLLHEVGADLDATVDVQVASIR